MDLAQFPHRRPHRWRVVAQEKDTYPSSKLPTQTRSRGVVENGQTHNLVTTGGNPHFSS